MDDRRAFLKKLAKGMVYSAPVVTTLAFPKELRAINISNFMMSGISAAPESQTGIGVPSPWAEAPTAAPPWSGNSPGTRPGGDEE